MSFEDAWTFLKAKKKPKKKWQYFSHSQHPEKEGPFQGSTLAYAYAKLRADPKIGKQFTDMKKNKQKEVAETLAGHIEENRENYGLTPLSPEQVSEFKDTKNSEIM